MGYGLRYLPREIRPGTRKLGENEGLTGVSAWGYNARYVGETRRKRKTNGQERRNKPLQYTIEGRELRDE